MEKRISKVTEVYYTVRVAGREIVEALYSTGVQIPPDARVIFQVPSGGDWSGMSLEVDDFPIEITWTQREES